MGRDDLLRQPLEVEYLVRGDSELGAGNLGTALCHYSGFSGGSFLVVGVLDSDPSRVGDPTQRWLPLADIAKHRKAASEMVDRVGLNDGPSS